MNQVLFGEEVRGLSLVYRICILECSLVEGSQGRTSPSNLPHGLNAHLPVRSLLLLWVSAGQDRQL